MNASWYRLMLNCVVFSTLLSTPHSDLFSLMRRVHQFGVRLVAFILVTPNFCTVFAKFFWHYIIYAILADSCCLTWLSWAPATICRCKEETWELHYIFYDFSLIWFAFWVCHSMWLDFGITINPNYGSCSCAHLRIYPKINAETNLFSGTLVFALEH